MQPNDSQLADLPADRPVVVRGGTVLTMDDSHSVLTDADVLVIGQTIAAVGPHLQVPDAAVEIDARGGIVMPGMIDTHDTCGRPPCAVTVPTGR